MRRCLLAISLFLAAGVTVSAEDIVSSLDCQKMPPFDNELADLIVSPVTPAARDAMREVLTSAGLPCITQLQATGDCLVRYVRNGRPEPHLVAAMLKMNIHALAPRAFNPRDQLLIGDVFVNEPFKIQGRPEDVVEEPPGSVTGPSKVSDPYFHKQLNLKALNAERAWEGVGTYTPIVAILDSGVWLDHPDFEGNLLPGVTIGCMPSPDCNGSPVSESHSHGTKLAGIIAARKGNGKGIIGTAWNAKIVPVNIGLNGGNDFSASCGVEIAIERGATVINMSWWKTARLQLLRKQLLAAPREVVFVAAAGSDGEEISQKCPSYPLLEELPNVIGVAAHSKKDEPDPSSNYSKKYVHIAAQSMAYTTQYCPSCDTTVDDPKLYELALGFTSYSTAYVTGVVALLKSRYPDWGHEWLSWRVINGAVFSQRLRHMSESEGRLDLAAIMFPVNTTSDKVDRTRVTLLDWKKGLRGDMCPQVAISARIGDPGNFGQYTILVATTSNDGEQSIPAGKMPRGAAKLIQFKVTCDDKKSDAESLPLDLVK